MATPRIQGDERDVRYELTELAESQQMQMHSFISNFHENNMWGVNEMESCPVAIVIFFF